MKRSGRKPLSRSAQKNLLWIGATLLLLVLAYSTASGFVVYALYAVLLTMVLSRLITEICLRGLVCRREISKTEATIGERIDVILTVKNTSVLPIPWVLIEELLPEKMPVTGDRSRLYTLGPHQEQKLLYQVVVNRRGYHQIGPALVEAGDLFGFFRRYKTAAENDFVTVFPPVKSISEYEFAARRPMGPVLISNRIFEDPTLISAVREYVPGDPFNRIHWKTTAHTGMLHTKIFEPSRVIGATIVLDLHRNGYGGISGADRCELAITTAASLTYYVAEANEQVGLLSNGRDAAETVRYEQGSLLGKVRAKVVAEARKLEKSDRLAPITVPTSRSPEQGRLILEALARIQMTDGLALDKTLLHSIQRISRNSTMLVIAPEAGDDLASFLSIMKESGFLISVLIIDNEAGYFQAVERLAGHFIDVYHIRNSDDIDKFATQDIYY